MFSRRAPLYYLALFLVVAGARLWAVAEYGSSVPIRDQWDYEGAAVFKPWLDGTLSISDLFRPHNEHRLAFSRLTGLLLLWLNGQWDSRVEMVVGAVLCGVFAVVMTAAMIRLFGPAFRTLIVEGVALWLVLPYAQENTIMALGLPYYFLLIFSVIAIWGLALHDTYSAAWGAGAVSLVLACLDMGSGFFAALVVIGVKALQLIRRRTSFPGALPVVIVCAAVIVASFYLRTIVAHHNDTKATSIGNWLYVFGRCLAWPFCDIPLLAVVMYLPMVLVVFWYLQRPRSDFPGPACRQAEALIAIGAWAVLQAAAIAYTRGASVIPIPVSRYMDWLALGALGNLFAGAFLVTQMPIDGRMRRIGALLFTYWAAALAIGAVLLSHREVAPLVPRGGELYAHEQTVRAYVATGEHSHLTVNPAAVPYPVADRLASLLDDEAIRNILPAEVRAPLQIEAEEASASTFIRDGYPPSVPNPAYERTWGSYSEGGEAATGILRSTATTTAFPYLQFEVAGRLQTRMSLNVRDENTGKQHRLRPERAGKEWRLATLTVPGQTFRIVAKDENSASWFAFREPRELGRLSRYAAQFARSGPILALIGLGLWLTIIVLERLGAAASPTGAAPQRGVSPPP